MESSHLVAYTTDIKTELAGLFIRKKRELAASIVANFDELFWVIDLDNNAEMKLDGLEDTDAVTTVAPDGMIDDIVGNGDTGDTLVEDEVIIDDGVDHDHVLHQDISLAGAVAETLDSSSRHTSTDDVE